jgi:ureidoglycolate hydrolase
MKRRDGDQSVDVKPLSSEHFARFGRVAVRPDTEPLASDHTFAFWSDVTHLELHGGAEIGYCTVFAQDAGVVDWMERHERTPELLIPIDAPIVLPVMTEQYEVTAFRIEIGQAAVIRKGVWHSACLPAGADEATYFVVFRRGTPGDDVAKIGIEPRYVERL